MTIKSQCIRCKNYIKDLKCKAFPKGPIPNPILLNEFDHKKEFPDDNGIRFELKNGK